MGRRRLLAALLPPEALALEVEGLRSALGDDAQARIPPHLTLVPPVNVRDDVLPDVLAHLRAAAAGTSCFDLDLGPVGTFHPVTPVLLLRVGGTGEPALRELRARLHGGPMGRPEERPFVPHVTIGFSATPMPEVVAALGSFRRPWTCEVVHLFELVQVPGGRRRWEPVADAPLGAGPSTVGTGGLELELATTTLVPPDLAAAWSCEPTGSTAPRDPGGPVPWWLPERDGLVVTARRGTEVLGGARLDLGSRSITVRSGEDRARLDRTWVHPDAGRQGIGRHLLRQVEHQAARRGMGWVEATAAPGSPLLGALHGLGWTVDPLGDRGSGASRLVRRLPI